MTQIQLQKFANDSFASTPAAIAFEPKIVSRLRGADVFAGPVHAAHVSAAAAFSAGRHA